jgi:hypothetical protein
MVNTQYQYLVGLNSIPVLTLNVYELRASSAPLHARLAALARAALSTLHLRVAER